MTDAEIVAFACKKCGVSIEVNAVREVGTKQAIITRMVQLRCPLCGGRDFAPLTKEELERDYESD